MPVPTLRRRGHLEGADFSPPLSSLIYILILLLKKKKRKKIIISREERPWGERLIWIKCQG